MSYKLTATDGLLEISWVEDKRRIYQPDSKIDDLLEVKDGMENSVIINSIDNDKPLVKVKGKCSPQVLAFIVSDLLCFFDVVAIWDEGLQVFIVSFSENNEIYNVGDKVL